MTGMMTAVTAVCSMIAIPVPTGVPVTLQTLAVSMCGFILGPGYGCAAVAVYILLGAMGLPVFSGMRGGADVLFGLTGGFIWGFLFLSLLCAFAVRLNKNKYIVTIISLCGVIICHICGIVQYMFISKAGFIRSLLTISLPFLLKDIILVMISYAVCNKIKRLVSLK